MATLNIGGTYYKIVHSETLTPGSLEKSLDHHLNQLSKEERFAFRREMESLVQTQELVSSAAEDEFELLMAELHADDEAYMRLFQKSPRDPEYKTVGDLDAEILKLGNMQKALMAIKSEREMEPQIEVWETIISRIESIEKIKRRRRFSSSSSSSGGRNFVLSPLPTDRAGMPITASSAIAVKVANVEENKESGEEA